MTTECVASVRGEPLERDAPSFETIRSRMERSGRRMAPSNAKQADFPRGAVVLPNPHGTAPGFSVELGRAAAFFLPGVPAEMKPMFQEHVAPAAAASLSGGVHQVRLRTFGLPESTVNDLLEGVEATHGVTIGYRAHFPEIEVKVLARRTSPAAASRAARGAADAIHERLGEAIYAEGETSLAEAVGDLLRDRGLTFGTAESCTGGLVAELMTEHAGASDFFVGAIVAYSNAVKTAVLGVAPDVLAARGAVSAEVACAMAEGGRRALGADVALALTGIAGPGGASPDKPVGLLHLAVATASGTTGRSLTFPSTRRNVRLIAAHAGLSLVRQVVKHGHDQGA
jgi:nicotinamide-nucleotide amidase